MISGKFLKAVEIPLTGCKWSFRNTLTTKNNENNEEQLKQDNAKEILCVYLFTNSFQKKRLRPLGLKGLRRGSSPFQVQTMQTWIPNLSPCLLWLEKGL